MKELRNTNIRNEYVRKKTQEIMDIEPKSIDFIDVGAMNYVYKVTTPKGILFFKQALKQAKNVDKIGQDLASIPPERIKYEGNVIKAIKHKMPSGITLPNIYQYDEKNNILILGDVALGGILLEEALLQGNFNPEVAAKIGKFLAISHKETYGKKIVIRGSEEEDRHNWRVFLNMRTKGINSDSLTKQELTRLFNDVLKNHTYDLLINMDCCPKNIFQRQDGSIGLIDFELASGCGDPVYDLGFALGHYFLLSVLKDVPDKAIECFDAMVNAYKKGFSDLDDEWQKRMIKYAGAVLIYRVAGSSPAPYVSQDRVEELIKKGSAIVTSNVGTLAEVIKILKGS